MWQRARYAGRLDLSAIMLSGGPDSTVLAHDLVACGERPLAITLNLGDREAPANLVHAKRVAAELGLESAQVDLSEGLREGFRKPFPQFMRMPYLITETVEPFGSGVALSLGASLAASHGADRLYYAVQGDDRIFRDNVPEYFTALSTAISIELGRDFVIETPYLDVTKAEVLVRGHALGVALGATWSCGTSSERQCGECLPCTMRQEAFAAAGLPDTTDYVQPRPVTAELLTH